jgi:hypothetical protein
MTSDGRRDAMVRMFRAAGKPATTRAEVDGAFEVMRTPSRDAVRYAANFARDDPRLTPLLCAELVEIGAYRPALQMALGLGWVTSSLAIRRAAGDRLVDWFRLADFSRVEVPLLRRVVRTKLPPALACWRGGRCSPEELAQGWSWTTDRRIAGEYCIQHTGYDPWAWPVLVRRGVRREDVLIAFKGSVHDGEVVAVPRPGDTKIDGATTAEIMALCRSSLPRHAEKGKRVREWAATTDDQFWQGWQPRPDDSRPGVVR